MRRNAGVLITAVLTLQRSDCPKAKPAASPSMPMTQNTHGGNFDGRPCQSMMLLKELQKQSRWRFFSAFQRGGQPEFYRRRNASGRHDQPLRCVLRQTSKARATSLFGPLRVDCNATM